MTIVAATSNFSYYGKPSSLSILCFGVIVCQIGLSGAETFRLVGSSKQEDRIT